MKRIQSGEQLIPQEHQGIEGKAGERSSNSNCVLSFCQPGDLNVAIMTVTQYMQAETHLSHSERIVVLTKQKYLSS